MKRLLLTTVVVVFAALGAKAGDIINTHFNTGDAWNYASTEISDCESKGDRANTEETTFTVDNFTFTVKDSGYAPTCGTKKTGAPEGLTAGYLEINKTTGYLIIPQQNSITTIDMAISATGTSGRGIIVEKAVNGGEWTTVLDQKLTKDDIGNNDIQSGYVLPTINVNESNVAIRIWGGTYAQNLRIHDLRVQSDNTGIATVDASKTVKSVDYFDVLGRRVTGQTSGLIIVKSAYDDGTVATKKIYRLK
jgi:hypothetical protein